MLRPIAEVSRAEGPAVPHAPGQRSRARSTRPVPPERPAQPCLQPEAAQQLAERWIRAREAKRPVGWHIREGASQSFVRDMHEDLRLRGLFRLVRPLLLHQVRHTARANLARLPMLLEQPI